MKKLFLLSSLFLVFSFSFFTSFAQPSLEWQKCLGGANEDGAYSIQQTSDGGYIVAGYTGSNDGDVSGNHGDYDYWIVKLTSSGTLEWQKAFGGIYGTGYTIAHSIQQTNDGGYIVAGYTDSNEGDVSGNHGYDDYWVVKLTCSGTLEWQKALGGTGVDDASSIQQTSDGGYIVAGETQSNDGDVSGNHGNSDYWVVKLTSSGTLEWQKALGGTSYDVAFSIQRTSDGGYIVAGYTLSNDGDVSGNHGSGDYWVVKLTCSGILEWQKAFGGTDYDYAYSIQQTNDGGYIVAGGTNSHDGDVSGNHGWSDYWVVKLNSGSGIEEWTMDDAGITIYPNPANDKIFIYFKPVTRNPEPATDLSVSIYNIQGKEMLKQLLTTSQPSLQTGTGTEGEANSYKSPSEYLGMIDISNLPKGMYFVKILGQDFVVMNKVLIQ